MLCPEIQTDLLKWTGFPASTGVSRVISCSQRIDKRWSRPA